MIANCKPQGSTELSPVDAWLATLLTYVVAYRRRGANGPALAQHALTLIEEAKPVFMKLGGNRATQKVAINLIGKGKAYHNGMPTPEFAAALLDVRGEMKSTPAKRKRLTEFLRSPDMTERQQSLASLLLRMMEPDTGSVESNDVKLDRLITVVPDNTLKIAMRPEKVERQSVFLNEAKMLMRRWTGRDDLTLTTEERERIAARDPERLKRFTKLKAKIKESWEQCIRAMIRANGNKPVKIADARVLLHKQGITHHSLGSQGLERLRIGEDSEGKGSLVLYTMDGKELMAKPANDWTIFWNKNWKPQTDDTYVFRFRGPFHEEGKSTAVRTVAFNARAKDSRSDKVLDTIPHMPTYRRRWLRDLNGADKTKRIYAAMTEILYHFAPRIGTVGNDTFGLSTITLGHTYQSKGGGVILSYIGKDSKPQRHVVNPDTTEMTKVVSILKTLMHGKKRSDRLWTDPRGMPINPPNENAYLKSIGFPLTAHKFRNIRGTELMGQLLANARIAKDAPGNDVAKRVKQLAVHVGTLLGHVSQGKVTPTTAIKAYIVPKVIHDFFASRGLRTPSWVPKAGRGNGEEE